MRVSYVLDIREEIVFLNNVYRDNFGSSWYCLVGRLVERKFFLIFLFYIRLRFKFLIKFFE